MPALTRSIIIRADDAGSAQGANLAIRSGIRAGAITAVGFMVPGPAFPHAVEVLRDLLGEVDIGLHATVNAEWDEIRWGPLLGAEQVPSLIDEQGAFTRTTAILRHQFVRSELLAEISAQLSALRSSGLSPRYLDTHMGFDWLPGVEEALENLAATEGLLFVPRTPPVLPESLSATDGIMSSWLSRIAAVPEGKYQLVTHPGSDTSDMSVFYHAGLDPGQIARDRAAETAALCNPRFLAGLAGAGARLVRFTSPN